MAGFLENVVSDYASWTTFTFDQCQAQVPGAITPFPGVTNDVFGGMDALSPEADHTCFSPVGIRDIEHSGNTIDTTEDPNNTGTRSMLDFTGFQQMLAASMVTNNYEHSYQMWFEITGELHFGDIIGDNSWTPFNDNYYLRSKHGQVLLLGAEPPPDPTDFLDNDCSTRDGRFRVWLIRNQNTQSESDTTPLLFDPTSVVYSIMVQHSRSSELCGAAFCSCVTNRYILRGASHPSCCARNSQGNLVDPACTTAVCTDNNSNFDFMTDVKYMLTVTFSEDEGAECVGSTECMKMRVYLNDQLLEADMSDESADETVPLADVMIHGTNTYLRQWEYFGSGIVDNVPNIDDVSHTIYYNVAVYPEALTDTQIAENYRAWLPPRNEFPDAAAVLADLSSKYGSNVEFTTTEDCNPNCNGIPLESPNGYTNADVSNNPFFDDSVTDYWAHNKELIVTGTGGATNGLFYDCNDQEVAAGTPIIPTSGCPDGKSLITYVPNENYNVPVGTLPEDYPYFEYYYRWSDEESNNDVDGTTFRVTLNVEPVNDIPEVIVRPNPVMVDFMGMTEIDFSTVAVDVDEGDSIVNVMISSMPQFGNLKICTDENGCVALTSNDIGIALNVTQLTYESTLEDVAMSGMQIAAMESIAFQVKDQGVPASGSGWSEINENSVFRIQVLNTLVACGSQNIDIGGCDYARTVGNEDAIHETNECIRVQLDGQDSNGRNLEYVIRSLPTAEEGILYQYEGEACSTEITAPDTVVTNTNNRVGFKPAANYFNSLNVEVPSTFLRDADCEQNLIQGKSYVTFNFTVQSQGTTFKAPDGAQEIAVVNVNDMPILSSTETSISATAGDVTNLTFTLTDNDEDSYIMEIRVTSQEASGGDVFGLPPRFECGEGVDNVQPGEDGCLNLDRRFSSSEGGILEMVGYPSTLAAALLRLQVTYPESLKLEDFGDNITLSVTQDPYLDVDGNGRPDDRGDIDEYACNLVEFGGPILFFQSNCDDPDLTDACTTIPVVRKTVAVALPDEDNNNGGDNGSSGIVATIYLQLIGASLVAGAGITFLYCCCYQKDESYETMAVYKCRFGLCSIEDSWETSNDKKFDHRGDVREKHSAFDCCGCCVETVEFNHPGCGEGAAGGMVPCAQLTMKKTALTMEERKPEKERNMKLLHMKKLNRATTYRVLGKVVRIHRDKKSQRMADALVSNGADTADLGDVELQIQDETDTTRTSKFAEENPMGVAASDVELQVGDESGGEGGNIPPPVGEASPLPPGWQEGLDPKTNAPYYYNQETQQTQWERPV